MHRVLVVVLALAGGGGVALAVRWATRAPSGPEPIAWDAEACAACGMHVGEPGFAAQIQLRDGHTVDFDDPGCLLDYELERHPDEAAVWFHDLRTNRWLSSREVAFVSVPRSPMGHGLGAVPIGTPGSVSLDVARARIAEEKRGRMK